MTDETMVWVAELQAQTEFRIESVQKNSMATKTKNVNVETRNDTERKN